MYIIDLQSLPVGKYNDVWFWMYENNIGNMRKQADDTGGYVQIVEMSEEEAMLLQLRWL